MIDFGCLAIPRNGHVCKAKVVVEVLKEDEDEDEEVNAQRQASRKLR
jgi:hypothetical protein